MWNNWVGAPRARAEAGFRGLTSLPYIMRWCVVMSALKTTIQLLLAVRSSSVSARWGMLTFSSLVQWIRSGRWGWGRHRAEKARCKCSSACPHANISSAAQASKSMEKGLFINRNCSHEREKRKKTGLFSCLRVSNVPINYRLRWGEVAWKGQPIRPEWEFELVTDANLCWLCSDQGVSRARLTQNQREKSLKSLELNSVEASAARLTAGDKIEATC